jgi:hypothetical protein
MCFTRASRASPSLFLQKGGSSDSLSDSRDGSAPASSRVAFSSSLRRAASARFLLGALLEARDGGQALGVLLRLPPDLLQRLGLHLLLLTPRRLLHVRAHVLLETLKSLLRGLRLCLVAARRRRFRFRVEERVVGNGRALRSLGGTGVQGRRRFERRRLVRVFVRVAVATHHQRERAARLGRRRRRRRRRRRGGRVEKSRGHARHGRGGRRGGGGGGGCGSRGPAAAAPGRHVAVEEPRRRASRPSRRARGPRARWRGGCLATRSFRRARGRAARETALFRLLAEHRLQHARLVVHREPLVTPRARAPCGERAGGRDGI